MHGNHLVAVGAKGLRHRSCVERTPHGVARTRVRQLQVEMPRRRQCGAYTSERNARGCERGECIP